MNGTSRRGFIGMLAALAAAPAALMAKVDDYRIKQYKHVEYGRTFTVEVAPDWNANDKETFLQLGVANKYEMTRTGLDQVIRAMRRTKTRRSIFWSETRKFGGDEVYVILTDYDFSGKTVPGGCVWRMNKTRDGMTKVMRKYRSMEWDMLENTCLEQCSEIPHALINGGGI